MLSNTALNYVSHTSAVTGVTITGGISSTHASNCNALDLSNITISRDSTSPSTFYTDIGTTGTFTVCNSPPMQSCSSTTEDGPDVIVHPGPMPSPSPVPTPAPCATGFPLPVTTDAHYADTMHLNALIQANGAVSSLFEFLSTSGMMPKLAFTSLPAGEAAEVTANSTTLEWDVTQVQTAIETYGQDDTQILYHELVHVYDLMTNPVTGSYNFPVYPNEPLNVAISGTAFSYPAPNQALSQAYADYEHAWVHNVLVDVFGTDRTGALLSALHNVDPAYASDATAWSATKFGTFSQRPPANPPLTYSCVPVMSQTRAARAVITVDRPLPDLGFSEVYHF